MKAHQAHSSNERLLRKVLQSDPPANMAVGLGMATENTLKAHFLKQQLCTACIPGTMSKNTHLARQVHGGLTHSLGLTITFLSLIATNSGTFELSLPLSAPEETTKRVSNEGGEPPSVKRILMVADS